MRKSRLAAVLLASLVLLGTACSEKEVPQPIEDTQRIDVLRSELRDLQQLIYGVELDSAILQTENDDLAAQVEELEAEIAALKEKYNSAVNYTVIAVDVLGNPVKGAEVTLNQNGTLVTEPTNAEGAVQFPKVRAGTVVAVVKATGYATVNYYATLAFANTAGVNTRIVMIPKKAETNATYTVTGHLYANINIANDTAGGVNTDGGFPFVGFKGTDPATKNAGALGDHRTYETVAKKITAKLWCDIDYVPFSRTSGKGGNSADLIELAYEDAQVTATFDANNNYTMQFPVTSIYQNNYGDEIAFWWELSFEEFVADQVLVDYDVNGTYNGVPNSAYPAPKTYTAKRLFKIYSGSEDSDDLDEVVGQKDPGSVVTQNWFYTAYTY